MLVKLSTTGRGGGGEGGGENTCSTKICSQVILNVLIKCCSLKFRSIVFDICLFFAVSCLVLLFIRTSKGKESTSIVQCLGACIYIFVFFFLPCEVSTPVTRAGGSPLSTGALVGIAIGVGVLVLLVLVICCVVYRRQKRQIDEYKEIYFLRSSDYQVI